MRFKATLRPPALKRDFDGCVASIKKKEKDKKADVANVLQMNMLNSKLPHGIVMAAIRHPAFHILTGKKVQVWRLLSANYDKETKTGIIEYEYDFSPVNIDTMAEAFELAKFVRKTAGEDLYMIIEGGQKKIWHDARVSAGLPEGSISLEVLPASPRIPPSKPSNTA